MQPERRDLKACELHVFDFDGTIFYSPSVDDATAQKVFTEQLRRDFPDRALKDIEKEAHSLVGTLSAPLSAAGLGWYQSLSSLSPPVVPQWPEEKKWFVEPTLDRIRHLLFISHEPVREDAQYDRRVVVYVLTGRDVKYTHRIRELLQCAGILDGIEYVFLKPTETAGSVKFKQNKLLEMIRRHAPRRVFYYDDRHEQGARIFAGLHEIQTILFALPEVHQSWGAQEAAVRVDVKDMPPDAAHSEGTEPSLSPHCFSTVCIMDDALPVSWTAASVTRAIRTVAFVDLFRQRSDPVKEATRAIHAGRRWAAESVAFLNSRCVPNSPSPPTVAPSNPQRRLLSSHEDSYAVEPVLFPAPPCFHFTLVCMPETVVMHSNDMLDQDQVRGLIETLQMERVAYDALTPLEREARHGGGHTAGGRGRGRGQGRGRGGSSAAMSRHKECPRRTDPSYQKAFPSLPGA